MGLGGLRPLPWPYREPYNEPYGQSYHCAVVQVHACAVVQDQSGSVALIIDRAVTSDLVTTTTSARVI